MRLKIEASQPLHVQAYGTLIGTLPIEVESIPKAIRIALPAEVTATPPAPAQPAVLEQP